MSVADDALNEEIEDILIRMRQDLLALGPEMVVLAQRFDALEARIARLEALQRPSSVASQVVDVTDTETPEGYRMYLLEDGSTMLTKDAHG